MHQFGPSKKHTSPVHTALHNGLGCAACTMRADWTGPRPPDHPDHPDRTSRIRLPITPDREKSLPRIPSYLQHHISPINYFLHISNIPLYLPHCNTTHTHTMAIKWLGKVPTHCNICRNTIQRTFVDAPTTSGQWAIMCPSCHPIHARHPGKLGTGCGQKFEKQGTGDDWIKTAG